MQQIPFMDLTVAEAPLRPALRDAIDAVLTEGAYVSGSAVATFEHQWAAYCGASSAVGVGNGTDAIEVALRALGVGPGDEVVVPGNTFIATAEAVVACGATPHFADVDPSTLLLSVEAAEAAITSRTAAILVVHLYGQPADMTALSALARRRGLALVEDCAQAHGARWAGQHVGTFGDAGCFSFYPSKNLGALGDAGAVVTSDSAVALRVRMLADHGRTPGERYGHRIVGRNSRMDVLQAAALSVKLPHLDTWVVERQRASALYGRLLGGAPGLVTTGRLPGAASSCHLEVVRVGDRDEVQRRMAEHGVQTVVHYPVPCHLQGGYEDFPRTDLMTCETTAPQLLSLPLYAGIPGDHVRAAAVALLSALEPQRLPPPVATRRTSALAPSAL